MALYIIIYIILSTAGLILLKSSLSSDVGVNYRIIRSLLLNLYFILGFIFYASSFVTWLYILSKKELTYAYPIVVGLSYVFIVITAFIIFKENITFSKIIGIVLIGLGVIFIVK